VPGRIGFVVLDTNGNTIGNEAQGNLIDISTGGVAFSIHSSQKKMPQDSLAASYGSVSILE